MASLTPVSLYYYNTAKIRNKVEDKRTETKESNITAGLGK